MKLDPTSMEKVENPIIKKDIKPAPTPVVEEPEELDEEIDEEDAPFDLDDDMESDVFDFDTVRLEIRNKNKAGTPEQKKAVKALLTATGKKLDELEDIEVLGKMLAVFE